jgi:LmbE family N-acetylglucosaminyl deacetylase
MAFPWLVREGLAPHRVRRLYLFWSEKDDARVDVSATIDRKFAALREHASQLSDFDALEARIREWMAEEGRKIGAAFADTFRVIVIDEDDDGHESEAEEASQA